MSIHGMAAFLLRPQARTKLMEFDRYVIVFIYPVHKAQFRLPSFCTARPLDLTSEDLLPEP